SQQRDRRRGDRRHPTRLEPPGPLGVRGRNEVHRPLRLPLMFVVSVTTSSPTLWSRGVHVGRGYVVSTLHSIAGTGARINGYEAVLTRDDADNGLAMLWCPGVADLPSPPLGSHPRNAVVDLRPHCGRTIAVYRIGRQCQPGDSGSGYYENGVLVGIIVGIDE